MMDNRLLYQYVRAIRSGYYPSRDVGGKPIPNGIVIDEDIMYHDPSNYKPTKVFHRYFLDELLNAGLISDYHQVEPQTSSHYAIYVVTPTEAFEMAKKMHSL